MGKHTLTEDFEGVLEGEGLRAAGFEGCVFSAIFAAGDFAGAFAAGLDFAADPFTLGDFAGVFAAGFATADFEGVLAGDSVSPDLEGDGALAFSGLP
jgi:hypothetical protein